MLFEDAMHFLRHGDRIYRMSDPDKGSLCAEMDLVGNVIKVFGSFHLSVYDVLADDWYFCDVNEDFNPLEPFSR